MEQHPTVIAGTDTYVTDPDDDQPPCTQPCCRATDVPTHWGQWLRPS
ncbi:hypothetical protein P3T36_001122 [Kitasatospora sp. MAP12-15]|nr:hypothetical protein [Kitasatospora sp. MAP12-44]MDH6114771.1 hypothetical protein [Kitasatospora sp. MAP12-44]